MRIISITWPNKIKYKKKVSNSSMINTQKHSWRKIDCLSYFALGKFLEIEWIIKSKTNKSKRKDGICLSALSKRDFGEEQVAHTHWECSLFMKRNGTNAINARKILRVEVLCAITSSQSTRARRSSATKNSVLIATNSLAQEAISIIIC